MTSKTKSLMFSTTAENILESSTSDADDASRRNPLQKDAQLIGSSNDCHGANDSAERLERIQSKTMRSKRRHEGQELHITKRRLTETLATVYEDKEEVTVNEGYRPAVKLHAEKQQSADDVTMHRRLQCEHLKLQKHFSLVQDLLQERTRRYAKQVSDLEDELRETRERHDLIEFQLLEIEQCQMKGIGKVAEKGVNTLLAGRCCKYGHLLEELMLKRSNSVPMDNIHNECMVPDKLKDAQNHTANIDKGIIREKITSLERTENELVTKNLKLYIEELQKRVHNKDESSLCLAQESPKNKEEVESHCTSAASEDEGLGEDSRRDESTGPNSLVLETEDDYQGHFDGVIVDLRKRETSLVSQLCQAEARICELQDRMSVKEEQVLKLLSESCNYSMMQEQLTAMEQKKSELQEQVLELEEAENDSRSEAQRLQMVVLTMEERERILEDEIHRAKIELERCECRLRTMEITDRELQAQVCYTEALVCKYEKHIGELESAETNLHHRIVELEHQLRMSKKGKPDTKSSFCQTLTIHFPNQTTILLEDRYTQTYLCPAPQDLPPLQSSNKDSLIFRLKQLEEKDCVLREQLHQMDGINLMLWQKLHSLDNNIELCKKQERRNFPEEIKHQVAAARLDDLLAAPQTNPVVNSINSLEEIELKRRLAQMEKEQDTMKKDLEAKMTRNNDIILKVEKEKSELEKQLEKVQSEKAQLQDSYCKNQLSECREGCQTCQHLTYAISQLKEEEIMLRSDITQHQVRVQAMCCEFENKLKDLTNAHNEKEESWKSENEILKEKEREYQEELLSLRETRKSLKSEICAMIQEKNAVLFELQNKLVALEERKKSSPRQTPDRDSKSYSESHTQTDDYHLQTKDNLPLHEVASECNIALHLETDARCQKDYGHQVEGMQIDSFTQCEQPEPENQGEMISTIEELRTNEKSLERRIEDLQQKESAYIETLENADKIISNLERGYQEKIVQLESSEKNLRQRIVELEESENQLRGMVYQPERRSSADGWKISDLVKELMKAEARENVLKEQIDEVEATHRTLLQRLRELERGNQQYKDEIHEQEDLLGSMREKERELRAELVRTQQSESALRLTLHQADEILAHRERSVLDQVESLEKDKNRLEETIERLRDDIAVLKVTNDRLKSQTAATTEQVEDKGEKRPPVNFEDLSIGLGARLELEECMTRAMAAMERDMERKSSMDERENIRSSDSTSGCESDCSSTYIWPTSEDSDSDHAADEPRPKKMLMTSSESSATVPSRTSYPTGTYTRMDKKAKTGHDKHSSSLAAEKDAESKIKTCKKANQDSTNQASGLLLPPENFSILRQVGKDSLLVGWKPRVAKNSSISYQIFVDGQLQQNIRSPDRTKTLLHKLDLSVPLNISIRSVSPEGDASETTSAFFTAPIQNSTPSVKV